MKKEMKNRVAAVVGTRVLRNNFNADLNGQPRQLLNGEFFINDKPLKFTIRTFWFKRGIKVFTLKTYKNAIIKGKETSIPRTQEERYTDLYGEIDKKKTSGIEIIKNLAENTDVKNFGIAFSVKENNISITGVTQILPGTNKMEDTTIEVITQLTPYKNSNKDESTASSMGRKYIVDEAHYFSDVIVNPSNLEPYKDFGVYYTEEDYLMVKQGLLKGVTALNTQTRVGCDNEFGLFIKLNEDSDLMIPCLTRYITFEKGLNGERDKINLTKISDLVNRHVKDIQDIEVYYDADFTELIGFNSDIPTTITSLY